MKSQRTAQTGHGLAGKILLWLIAVSLLSVVAPALVVGQTNQTKVMETLQTVYGPQLEVVNAFDPYFLTGDFNGDGAEDLIAVVRIRSNGLTLPGHSVRRLNPFGPRTSRPPNETLAFMIIHGTRAGWQTPQPGGTFLLSGESPILILENSRAISDQASDRKDLMELIRKRVRGRRVRNTPRAPAAARGDAIFLGTEAADGFLFWNGKTYRWEESAGGE